MPGELKRLKCKAVGPRAVLRYGKTTRTRTVSIRKDGAFVVTSGKLRGRRCSIRNIGQDRDRKSPKRVKPDHRHQGDMGRGRRGASKWI